MASRCRNLFLVSLAFYASTIVLWLWHSHAGRALQVFLGPQLVGPEGLLQESLIEDISCVRILSLHAPWRHFDSDHWFHLAEYYLPHFLESNRLDAVCEPVAGEGLGSRPSVVFVLTNDPEFVDGVSAMGAFLVKLFLVPDIFARVVFVPPTEIASSPSPGRMCFALRGAVHVSPGLGHGRYDVIELKRACCDSQGQLDIESCPFPDIGALLQCRRANYENIPICGQFIGVYGEAPVERGKWFRNDATKLKMLRDNSKALLELERKSYPDEDGTAVARDDRYSIAAGRYIFARDVSGLRSTRGFKGSRGNNTILVFQRDLNRKLVAVSDLLKKLHYSLNKGSTVTWTIELLQYSDHLPPHVVLDAFQGARVVITSHGFQCIGIMFSDPGSLLVEIFPYNYFKLGYKFYAEELGIHHRWLQNSHPVLESNQYMIYIPQSWCMLSRFCRRFARRDDVVVSDIDVDLISSWTKSIFKC